MQGENLFASTFVPLYLDGPRGKFPLTGKSKRALLAPENPMRYLAKNFSVKTLTLQLIFVAIIAVSIAGVARHSPLLEWSALIAIFVLLVADPLASHDKVGATPSTAGVKDSAVSRRIFTPNKTSESIADSVALINSQV